MRIAVDARELAGKPTGVGRYLAELLACWSREPAAARHEFLLLTPGLLRLPAGLIGSGGARVDSHVIPGNSPGANRGGLAHLLWEQRPLPAAAVRLGADVLFCPGYSGPMRVARAGGRVDPRRVVLGASRMVQGPRRPAPQADDLGQRPPRAARADADDVLARRDHPLARRRRLSASAPSRPAPAASSIPPRVKACRPCASTCSASRRRRRARDAAGDHALPAEVPARGPAECGSS